MINKKNLFLNIQSYLFVILPLLLITGPFLSDLAVSLISLIFLIYLIKNNKLNFLKDTFFKFFLVFWIYILINSFIQNQNIDSIRISLFFIRYGIFVYAVVYILNQKKEILKYFFYCLLISFLILIFDGYLQYFTGQNILGFKIHEGPRVSSFFNEELILGSYISRLFPILFGTFILFNKDFKNKNFSYLMIFIFIFSEVLVFISGERAAFFYINLSAIFMIVMFNKYKKLRIFSLSLSIIIIILISSIKPDTYNRIFVNTYNQMNLTSIISEENNDIQNNKIYIFSKQHNDHYLSAMKMFKDNILLGVGIKNFRNFCNVPKYKISNLSCSSHPHNSYLQILTETGIIGFIFLLSALIIFIVYSIKHFFFLIKKKKLYNDFQISLLSAILITLWPAVPTGNIFNNWLGILYFLPIGIFLWSIK